MATPRVFISSTCYDLKYIRENLKYFIRTLGYEPVLSDEGDVYYNPSSHTHDSCLREVATCQIFVLIIGGRYGGGYKETDQSITNLEYKEAIANKIPVFAMVEAGVHSDHHLFTTNKKDKPDLYQKITYPNADNVKIFDFLDEVRKSLHNNAIFPFRDFSDMESYLKKQWAGMMFDFLDKRLRESHSELTNKLLDDLSLATRKSEELIKLLLKETQPDKVKAEATILDVDNKIEAENFVRVVFKRFEINKLKNITINELSKINLTTWFDFLAATKNFYFEEIADDNNVDTVLFNENGGLVVATSSEGTKKISTWSDLEKSFSALKKLDTESQKSIFKILIEGFD